MQKIIFHLSLTSAAGMTKAEQFIENQNHNQARNMQITISSGNYNIKSRYLDKRVEIKFYIHILISILSLVDGFYFGFIPHFPFCA